MSYALVDIGNTSIKAKVFDDSNQSFTVTIGRHIDALLLFFTQLNIDNYLISSVVPSLNKQINSFNKPNIQFLDHSYFNGLSVKVDPIESVGIDRLVNAIAIKHQYKQDAIIIDIGTCVTFCHIKQTGDYYGGIIMPGFEMVRNALYSGAEQLPLVQFPDAPPKLVGNSTVSAMESGIFYGAIHMINGVVNELRSRLGHLKVILTGGAPSALLNKIDHDDFNPNLQFDGLEILFKDNVRH
ncbi:MAG: type III pantothenate kinase [Candidatus Margulisiibacteriota bacterium]|nr:type III pantothenate kinase [Candidatus Margulisiibacteriota bacterium]